VDDAGSDAPTLTIEPGDVLVRPGPYTLEDLDALPENGCRHELPNGVLLIMGAPATRHQLIGPTMEILAAAGCPSYWTIDPREPALTVWSLHEGRYVETVRVAAQETWTATEPFAVAITPVELLDL